MILKNTIAMLDTLAAQHKQALDEFQGVQLQTDEQGNEDPYPVQDGPDDWKWSDE